MASFSGLVKVFELNMRETSPKSDYPFFFSCFTHCNFGTFCFLSCMQLRSKGNQGLVPLDPNPPKKPKNIHQGFKLAKHDFSTSKIMFSTSNHGHERAK
nr:hypothetical protein Itr_chr12CG10840 [Ipomoea trifida]